MRARDPGLTRSCLLGSYHQLYHHYHHHYHYCHCRHYHHYHLTPTSHFSIAGGVGYGIKSTPGHSNRVFACKYVPQDQVRYAVYKYGCYSVRAMLQYCTLYSTCVYVHYMVRVVCVNVCECVCIHMYVSVCLCVCVFVFLSLPVS